MNVSVISLFKVLVSYALLVGAKPGSASDLELHSRNPYYRDMMMSIPNKPSRQGLHAAQHQPVSDQYHWKHKRTEV